MPPIELQPLERRTCLSASFAPPIQSPVGPVTEMAAGDFNRDGYTDLAVAASSPSSATAIGGVVRILAGNGTGKFTAVRKITVGSNISALAAADFNKDGILDLAVASNNEFGTVTVLLGTTFGTLVGKTYFVGANPQDLAVGDFDGNGTPDIMVANRNPWSLPYSEMPTAFGAGLLRGFGNGAFASVRRITLIDGQTSVAAGDINGDGLRDAVFGGLLSRSLSPIERPLIYVAISHPGGYFTTSDFSPFLGKIAGVALARLNNDPWADLAVVQSFADSTGGGDATLHTYLGLSDGRFAEVSAVKPLINAPVGLSVGDVNRDGRPDFVVAGIDARPTPLDIPPQGAASVLLGTGNGGVAAPQLFVTGPIPAVQALADVNRDGLLDILTGNPTGVSALLNTTTPVVL